MATIAAATTKLTIQPRLQVEAWSLYWKESMNTNTKVLPSFELDMPAGATADEVCALAAARLGWRATHELRALPGFGAKWDRLLVRGTLLAPDSDVAAAAAAVAAKDAAGDGADNDKGGAKAEAPASAPASAPAEVTYVRIELVAEGWKLDGGDLGSDSDGSDTDGDGL